MKQKIKRYIKYKPPEKGTKFLKNMLINRLSLRNVVAIAICLAALTMFFSCEKSSEIEGKKELSPPQWIQGEWEYDGIVYNVYFKFIADDVFFSLPYGSKTSFSNLYEDGKYSIDETKKTNEIYEITVTRNKSKKMYNFKKGDDETHIQYYFFDTDVAGLVGANDVIYILYNK